MPGKAAFVLFSTKLVWQHFEVFRKRLEETTHLRSNRMLQIPRKRLEETTHLRSNLMLQIPLKRLEETTPRV
jgi:hypothetical protein